MQSWSPLADFLIAHGSLLLLPLAVIEGPIVSVIAGFLSARGYLDWYWALSLLVCGDLIGDVIYYWIGRSGRAPLAGLGRRLMRAEPSAELTHGLRRNATRMLLIGKWTHSIGALVLMGAGMIRLNLAKFMLVNLAATLPKSGVLFGLGYFAWTYYLLLARHLLFGSVLLLLVGSAAILLLLRRSSVIWTGGAGR